MSNQPSLISNYSGNLRTWQEVIKLADVLTTQYSFESLISYITKLFREKFSFDTKLWLTPSLASQIDLTGFPDTGPLLDDLSPLMELAFREKRVITNLQNGSMDDLTKLAIPLLAGEEIIGIIQLEKYDQIGIQHDAADSLINFTSQVSLCFSTLRQKSHSEYLQQNIDHLTAIEAINKSILSNLDKESLLNSILSLLHQKFGFGRVNIYTDRWGDKKEFIQFGISEDGIDPTKIYEVNPDSGPVAWAILYLEPVIVHRPIFDQQSSKVSLFTDIQSELIFPLLCGEIFIGVLDLCSESVDYFGPDTLKGYQLLAQNIAVAIRNADLYRTEQMRGIIYERLQKTIGKITADATIDDSLQNLFNEIEGILPWDAAAIWLIENSDNESEHGQTISLMRLAVARISNQFSSDFDSITSEVTNEIFERYVQNPTDTHELLSAYTWMSEIINSEKPLIRKSGSAYEPLGALLSFDNEYSAIGAPLTIDDQLRGIIVFVHHLKHQYDYESRSITSILASNLSIAIENIKTFTAAHDQAWTSTVLLQVAETTQVITNIDELLETVVSMLPGLIGMEACAIFLWDQSMETFYIKTSSGFGTEQVNRWNGLEIYPGSVPAFDQILQGKNPVILNSKNIPVETVEQAFPNYDFNNDLVILFPLFSQDNIYGTILIDFTNSTLEKNSSQEIWDEKFTLIQGAARYTAIAIENIQLIKSQQEEAYISVALLQVAQAIVSLNQLDEILGSIVRITPILVGVKRCIIYLWDSKDQAFHQSESYGFSKNDLSALGQVFKANEFPFIEAILQSNQIIYHPMIHPGLQVTWNEIAPGDYQVVERIISDSEEDVSIRLDDKSLLIRERLLIGFPLSVKGDMLGVMLIEEEDPIKGSPSLHIREKRIEIVKGITQQAAIAIKNELLQQEAVKSERMEQELQLAREIQTTFLPDRLPELLGWDISVKWQPARQVGGDFYDFLMLDGEQIGFVIADVADKGMPAALFMTLIRTLIRAAAKEKTSPAAVLRQVNELLVPDSKHGMFVTVFYAVFSLNSGIMVYANAGHNPPIIKQVEREELIELTRTSMALGIFSDILVEEREILLHPGDWMLLYTDGVTEAFSAKEEMFGTDRLFKLLSDYQFKSSNELIERIEDTILDFIRGTDLSDDLTVAAISRKVM